MKRFFIFLGMVLLGACAPFQDSPFSDGVLHSEKNLNSLGISRVGNIESDSIIRLAIFADSHQNYNDLDRVILRINKTADIDFVINLGDFTNSAYNMEYDQFLTSYLRISRPTVNVLGNHDAVGAGPSLFRKIFGNPNYYFESSSLRFVFFNSANLESPSEFDPDWLLSTVSSSTKPVLIFTHVPLIDSERFTGSVGTTLLAVVQHANTKVIFNGHRHVFDASIESGTHLVQSPRAEGGRWLLVEIQGTQLDVQEVNGGGTLSTIFKP